MLDVARSLSFWLVSNPVVTLALRLVTLQIPDSTWSFGRSCAAHLSITAERTSVTQFSSDEASNPSRTALQAVLTQDAVDSSCPCWVAPSPCVLSLPHRILSLLSGHTLAKGRTWPTLLLASNPGTSTHLLGICVIVFSSIFHDLSRSVSCSATVALALAGGACPHQVEVTLFTAMSIASSDCYSQY